MTSNDGINQYLLIEGINSDNKTGDAGDNSLTKVILIFYLILMSNYTHVLMSKQLKEFIERNRLVQHIIGYLTMVILVTLFGNVDTRLAMAYAGIAYVWFILSTKLDIHWSIIILLLSTCTYMYENNMAHERKLILADNNLSDKEKAQKIMYQNSCKKWSAGLIIVITIIGTLFYSHKKYEQYGGGYDVFMYLLQ